MRRMKSEKTKNRFQIERKRNEKSSKVGSQTGKRGNKEIHKKEGKDSQQEKKKNPNIICPIYHKCGGCQLQNLSYPEQLRFKQKKVEELIGGYGKVEPIIGMKEPLHYRNKIHSTFDRTKKGIISGVYEEGTHNVINVDTCYIQDQRADAIIRSIRDLLVSFKIKTYDEDTGYGLFRHVLIRTGYHSGEIMVVLVLGSPILPSKNNFVKALRKLHPEITTIVLNVNNKRTSMILGEKETVLYGKGYIEDTLCEKVFRISPKSFYQVNPVQTELLYNTAIEYAGLTGKETIVDAYCGIGTIGIIASNRAKEVISVEQNADAVRDARTNAKRNHISNIQFFHNDAGQFMIGMAEQNVEVDVVFMDPPRAGSDEAFLSSVVRLTPKKVVYISCSPETLARDLNYLTKNGYQVKKMRPVDMFPFTSHVESIVLLSRKEK